MKLLLRCLSVPLASSIWISSLWAQQTPEAGPPSQDRIVTPEEAQEAVNNRAIFPFRILSYPHRVVTRGMEKGLIKAEKNHLRERLRQWQDRMRELGITAMFGGMGEQTGFGGGGSYTLRPSKSQQIIYLARGTLATVPELVIGDLAQVVAKAPQQPTDQYGRTPLVRILIQTDKTRGDWALPVEVFIGRQAGNPNLQVLGWTHAPRKR